jgi:hypothetical protein
VYPRVEASSHAGLPEIVAQGVSLIHLAASLPIARGTSTRLRSENVVFADHQPAPTDNELSDDEFSDDEFSDDGSSTTTLTKTRSTTTLFDDNID